MNLQKGCDHDDQLRNSEHEEQDAIQTANPAYRRFELPNFNQRDAESHVRLFYEMV